jgi:hypothetical protein
MSAELNYTVVTTLYKKLPVYLIRMLAEFYADEFLRIQERISKLVLRGDKKKLATFIRTSCEQNNIVLRKFGVTYLLQYAPTEPKYHPLGSYRPVADVVKKFMDNYHPEFLPVLKDLEIWLKQNQKKKLV